MAWKQLSAMLEEILAVARAWCWEYGNHGKGGRVRKVAEPSTGSDGPRYSGMETGDSQVGE